MYSTYRVIYHDLQSTFFNRLGRPCTFQSKFTVIHMLFASQLFNQDFAIKCIVMTFEKLNRRHSDELCKYETSFVIMMSRYHDAHMERVHLLPHWHFINAICMRGGYDWQSWKYQLVELPFSITHSVIADFQRSIRIILTPSLPFKHRYSGLFIYWRLCFKDRQSFLSYINGNVANIIMRSFTCL